MGINGLNVFIRRHCTTASNYKIHLKELQKKTIVVDASIYIYKFLEKNALIENMTNMISIFKQYSIKPIFVFDGKKPTEQIIKERRMTEDYDSTETDDTIDDMSNMMLVKKKSVPTVKMSSKDIFMVKDLLKKSDIQFYTADGESDQLCASLVNSNKKIWACLSDDTDMFVYGCKRVIRHISLAHHTALSYDTNAILKELNISLENFRKIVALSGTDYEFCPSTEHLDLSDIIFGNENENNKKMMDNNNGYEYDENNLTIEQVWNIFLEYKNTVQNQQQRSHDFYHYLLNQKKISSKKKIQLEKIVDLFSQ